MLVAEMLTGKLKNWLKKVIPVRYRQKIRSILSRPCTRGKGAYIHRSVQMLGAGNVSIGNNTCIGEHSWLNVNHRHAGEIAISIGSQCFIGRRNFFSSGKVILIGDYVLTTNDCRFICSSHIIDNPLVPYITSGTTSTDSINVGVNCFFGAASAVIGNVSIGHGSVIGAAAVVTKDVPPFSIVLGYPAKVVKRYSFSRKLWIDIDQVTEGDLLENPDEKQYLRLIQSGYPHIDMPIIASGSDLGNL